MEGDKSMERVEKVTEPPAVAEVDEPSPACSMHAAAHQYISCGAARAAAAAHRICSIHAQQSRPPWMYLGTTAVVCIACNNHSNAENHLCIYSNTYTFQRACAVAALRSIQEDAALHTAMHGMSILTSEYSINTACNTYCVPYTM